MLTAESFACEWKPPVDVSTSTTAQLPRCTAKCYRLSNLKTSKQQSLIEHRHLVEKIWLLPSFVLLMTSTTFSLYGHGEGHVGDQAPMKLEINTLVQARNLNCKQCRLHPQSRSAKRMTSRNSLQQLRSIRPKNTSILRPIYHE